jgi:hypothetical protein
MKLAQPIALALFALTVANVAYASGGDLLDWSDCPPGAPYYFAGDDPLPAHFQTSPVAGPSGGSCSLDVVSGSQVVPAANSTGGVAFLTPGQVAGGTYTVAFDFQFVSGTDDWLFADESGEGDLNGLSFVLPYPGDHCWHSYAYTASVGDLGPKPVLFIYQDTPGFQEMRIDNMTITPAAPGAAPGLVSQAMSCSQCGE